jgi:ABC-2 type transport system permease protein
MRRIFAQMRKELTQIARDRLALVLALALPLGLMMLLGNSISLTVTGLPIIVQDLDDSPSSRSFIDAFRASITFHVVPWSVAKEPVDAFLSNTARGALIIPEHFGRDLARGTTAEVQLLVDGTDANTAKLVQGYAGEIVANYQPAAAPVKAEIRLWFNPGRVSKKFYGPGIFVLGLSMFPPLLAARDVERGRAEDHSPGLCFEHFRQ